MERKPVRRGAQLAIEPIRNGITVALKGEEAFGMSATQIEGDLMNSLGKLVVRMGLLSLLCVMPLAAQIENGVDFKTTFPFYAGNAKMPAGSYHISPSDIDSSVLQVQSNDGTHSAFVDFVPTHAEQPHSQTDVTFHKYGDTDYLNRIWVNGQSFGMKVEPTKAETKAATNASVVEHSVVASNR